MIFCKYEAVADISKTKEWIFYSVSMLSDLEL